MKPPDARIIELCDRLTSAGSAQHKLSASELHELADYIYEQVEETIPTPQSQSRSENSDGNLEPDCLDAETG